MEKIKFVKEIGYVILVVILLAAFIYRLGLSNVGKLELMIYVMFFSLVLVHLLKRNKKK
jgi:Ca2+/Na+ antiporter